MLKTFQNLQQNPGILKVGTQGLPLAMNKMYKGFLKVESLKISLQDLQAELHLGSYVGIHIGCNPRHFLGSKTH